MTPPSLASLQAVAVGLAFVSAASAVDLTLTVTNAGDSGSGTLREALTLATNGDTIVFDPALNGATITLTSGSLMIDGLEVTIDASFLPSGVTLSGNDSSRVMTISGSGSDVTLSQLTFRDGREASGSGGGLSAESGRLTMNDCTIRDCYATYNGGGIYLGNGIAASLDRCSILGNESRDFGGGLVLISTASASITNSVIAGNRCINSGGGGICNLADSPTLTNVTIQGNSGGGIRNFASSLPVLRNSIVWGNSFPSGTTAGAQLKNTTDTRFDVENCLIEGASGPASFNDGNRVTWGSSNLDGTVAASNPKFAASIPAAGAPSSAADLRLLAGSPAINTGANPLNSSLLDRAGFPRIQTTTIDLGAFESGYVTFSSLHPTLDPAGDENLNGISNYSEYALGIHPSGPDNPSALPRLFEGAESTYLTSTLRFNGLDVNPVWVTSTTLDPLSWEIMMPLVNYEIDSTYVLSPGRQQVVFKLLDSNPQRFYRQGFSTEN